jgi:hypothetical protein
MFELMKKVGYTGMEFRREHERRGAQIIYDFLIKEGADQAFASRVKSIVAVHEEGGDDDQNTMKDADSVSFFENLNDLFPPDEIRALGYEKAHLKFDWMFERICSDKAKKLARPNYEKLQNFLETLK